MPCLPSSPTQSSDSTQITLQHHSTRAPVCDSSMNSEPTCTAPMSTKPLDRVLAVLLPTNSNRIRLLPTICSPITAITPIPSSAILHLPTLRRWREVLVQRTASQRWAPSCQSYPSLCPYGFAHQFLFLAQLPLFHQWAHPIHSWADLGAPYIPSSCDPSYRIGFCRFSHLDGYHQEGEGR